MRQESNYGKIPVILQLEDAYELTISFSLSASYKFFFGINYTR
jgi:hypothetical protein